MKVLLILCLLFSLISPVVLLTCQRCLNRKGTECPKALNETCNPDSACRSSIFGSNEFHIGKVARKTCTPSDRCDSGDYSVTTSGGGFLKMLVDCCTEDNCNSKNLEFSSEPMEPNGLECEGCATGVRGACEGVKMIKCLGDQTKCISMKINFLYTAGSSKVFRTKGCATPLMCDKEKVRRNMDVELLDMTSLQVNCTDAILSPNA